MGGPAHILVTNLGPEGFTEWRRALINEATGKVPRLFGALENGVLSGKFEPSEGALAYGTDPEPVAFFRPHFRGWVAPR
jgi:hypothetical protein